MGGVLWKTGNDKLTDAYESPWDIEVENIHGETKLLGDYIKDKKIVMIINVASK